MKKKRGRSKNSKRVEVSSYVRWVATEHAARSLKVAERIEVNCL